MKIGIFGTGAFGLALSSILTDNKCEIDMWTKFSEEKENLEEKKSNEKVLPNYFIGKNIRITNNIETCIKNKDLIIIAIPVPFIEDLFKDMKPYISNDHIVITSKGITKDGVLPSNLIENYLDTKNYAILGGPTFAKDIIEKKPIAFTLATRSQETKDIVLKAFKNSYVKIDNNQDIIGTELCGSIKNVYAIISGMLSGIPANDSTRALFLVESIHDLCYILDSLNADCSTALSYAGIGDFLLTCSSTNSRNYTYGQMLGRKKSKEQLKEYIESTTVEGYHTLTSLMKIMKEKNINIPLIAELYNIIYENDQPEKVLDILASK